MKKKFFLSSAFTNELVKTQTKYINTFYNLLKSKTINDTQSYHCTIQFQLMNTDILKIFQSGKAGRSKLASH